MKKHTQTGKRIQRERERKRESEFYNSSRSNGSYNRDAIFDMSLDAHAHTVIIRDSMHISKAVSYQI
jgi:hypothetical protein